MAKLSSIGGGEHFYLYYAKDILDGGTSIVPAFQLSKDSNDLPINSVGIGTSTISKSGAPPTWNITSNEFSEEMQGLINNYVNNLVTEAASAVSDYNLQSGGVIKGSATSTATVGADFFVIEKITDSGQFQNRAGEARVKIEFAFVKMLPASADENLAMDAWNEMNLQLEVVAPPSDFEGIALSAISSLPGYAAPASWIDSASLTYYSKSETTGKVAAVAAASGELNFQTPSTKWIQDVYCDEQ